MSKINLKRLRENANLTQSELAERVGLKRYSISDWENERTEPDIESIKRLAHFFNVSTDYLLGRSDTPNEAKEEDLDDYKFALYGEVRDLTPAEKDEILRLVKFYASELKNKKK